MAEPRFFYWQRNPFGGWSAAIETRFPSSRADGRVRVISEVRTLEDDRASWTLDDCKAAWPMPGADDDDLIRQSLRRCLRMMLREGKPTNCSVAAWQDTIAQAQKRLDGGNR
jgi:hypothetical protein